MNGERLIVVSNRLPVTVRRSGGEFCLESSGGGLVSAKKLPSGARLSNAGRKRLLLPRIFE